MGLGVQIPPTGKVTLQLAAQQQGGFLAKFGNLCIRIVLRARDQRPKHCKMILQNYDNDPSYEHHRTKL